MQAEEALRISEARFRSVVEHAPASILEVDREGVILSQNRALSDRPYGTILGESIFSLLSPTYRNVVHTALAQVFEHEQPVSYETSIVFAPDDIHHFVSYAGPISVDAIVTSAVIVSLDITDLKRAQSEVRAQRDFARQVMDALGQGLVVADDQQRAAYANPLMAHLLGREQGELIGSRLTDFVAPEDLPRVEELLGQVRLDQEYQFELQLRTGANISIPALVTSSPRRHNGEVVGRIALFTDLTEVKKIETELRRSRDELTVANTALEQALRMKDEFLAAMSHELRTPLTGIMGLSEVLQMQTYGPLNDRQLRSVETIWTSGQHLLALINDILDFSKLAAAQFELELEICNAEDVCTSSLSLVKGMAQKKGHTVDFEMESAPILLPADPRRLKQMLVNLLSNAVKFTPEHGQLGLRVRVDVRRDVVEFIVWDHGIGIDPADTPRLFQPFTQLDSSLAREYSGTGLGLALVHRMAQLHHGTIDLVSSPGQGSTFTLTLPRRDPTIKGKSGQSRGSMAPGAGMPQTDVATLGGASHTRLLVAEDDIVSAGVLSEYLEAKGYVVEIAYNGAEAVQIASDFRPDLIFMDIRMPMMDGLQAIRAIREQRDAALASVPIVALTAQAMPGDAEACLAAGADDYLVKPYRFADILNTILRHLSNGTHAA